MTFLIASRLEKPAITSTMTERHHEVKIAYIGRVVRDVIFSHGNEKALKPTPRP